MTRNKHRLHWQPDAVAYTVDQFRDWMFSAVQGERCLYHIGQITIDREDRPYLKEIGDYVVLMSDFGAVAITQRRVDADLYQYFAARLKFNLRTIPRAVAVGDVDVRTFRSLRAIHTRDPYRSAQRAVRDALTCSEAESQKVINDAIKAGLAKDGRPPSLTDAGKAMLI